MLEELRDQLRAALGRNGANAHLCWTFVTSGPHGLPIRPRLLASHEDGRRVYAMSGKQATKVLALIDAEIESHTYDLPDDPRLDGTSTQASQSDPEDPSA